MNKITRKLFISVLTLAFALVTLGATTFAWFTLTTTVDVDKIDLTIVAGTGIEISADGTNYGRRVSVDEIKMQKFGNITTAFPELRPLTTEDGVNFFEYQETFEPASLMHVTSTVGFLEFKLWFRSPQPGALVKLNSSTSVTATPHSWEPDKTFNYINPTTGVLQQVTAGTGIQINAANAVRFSFEEFEKAEDSVFEDSLGAKVFELKGTLGNIPLFDQVKLDGLVDYWFKKLNKNIFDNGILTPLQPAQFIHSTSLPSVKLPSKVYTNDLTSVNDTSIFSWDTPVVTLVDEGTGSDINYYGYTVVRIWLEGWDPDNFDSIMGRPISVVFSFDGAEE